MTSRFDLFSLLPKGTYEVSELLSRGALGSVYRARQIATGKHVALKVIQLPNTEALLRLQREITLMGHLRPSPNLVTLIDAYVSYDEKAAILVSEWVDGPTLQMLVDTYR